MERQELNCKIMIMGDVLRSWRKHANLTQAEFAQIISASVNKVCEIERGYAVLNAKQILLACEYFGVSADELLQTDFANQHEALRLFDELDEQAQKEVCDFIKFKQASKGLNTI